MNALSNQSRDLETSHHSLPLLLFYCSPTLSSCILNPARGLIRALSVAERHHTIHR